MLTEDLVPSTPFSSPCARHSRSGCTYLGLEIMPGLRPGGFLVDEEMKKSSLHPIPTFDAGKGDLHPTPIDTEIRVPVSFSGCDNYLTKIHLREEKSFLVHSSRLQCITA